MAREFQGWTRPRPLRVAFLVEDGEHSGLALDGIFADCYDRWGGRFSLIAPCVDGRIAQSYWAWLEAYDPDIVYSYVPLSRADVLEVHERLCPSQYFYHEFHGAPRLDVFGFKPSYDFSPLSSLSIIFKLARYSPAAVGVSTVKIIDSWHSEAPSQFLTDNFGTYHVSRGSGMYPRDAVAAASLLTIVSQKGGRSSPRDVDQIPNEMVAFREFVDRRAISLSLASTLFAPKLEIRAERWSRSFSLVIGDRFADRIIFWNTRLLLPNWLDNDLYCLRIGADQLRDPEFLAILGDLLRHRNYVTAGSGSQPQLAIRSASLSVSELADALKLVVSTKPWSVTRVEPVKGFDDIVPSQIALEASRRSNRFIESSRTGSSRFLWSPPIARPPTTAPDHLSDAPVRQSFTEGYWCNDFTFEHDGPGSRFRAANHWMLPLRWRMAGAFKASLVNEPLQGAPPRPRRSRDGKLTIIVSADHPVETIKIPSINEAMRYALAVDGVRAEPDAEHGQIYPTSKVVWTDPSNEARYLTGVLGMTGGLQRARRFLLHPFLRDMFARFGGSPNLPADKLTPTVTRLLKRAQSEATFDLNREGERKALADMIVRASRSLKNPIYSVGYDELKDSWKAYRKEYWTKNPQPGADTEVDWDKHEESSLDACLVDMRRRQMVFQGHRWTCRNCHHRNWVSLAALSTELSCEVCKQSTQTPVNIRWLFRPNEFLIESLRDHSALSLVWTLSALCERSRDSLMFVEPTCFGFKEETTCPDAEADLLIVIDGQAMLCEVKSSWHSLRRSQITDLVTLAIRLRPDIAMLAVMETGAGPTADLDQARDQLAAEGIRFELLTPDRYSPEDDPYLPFENGDEE
jgi:hypothetical protein